MSGSTLSEVSTLQERHLLLTTILDAVYIDLKDKESVISIRAKAAFRAFIDVTNLPIRFDVSHKSASSIGS